MMFIKYDDKKRLVRFSFIIVISWIIFLIIGLFVNAYGQQIELVRPADFRYHVTVDGDTVSARSLDYKAYQDAVNFMAQFPNSLIVVHPVGVELRGSVPVIYDTDIITVDAPADTVEIYTPATVKQYDNAYNFSDVTWHPDVLNMNFLLLQDPADTTGAYQIAIDGVTGASEIRVATNCFGFDGYDRTQLINERTGGAAVADSTGAVYWQSETLSCAGIMTYWITERDSGNFSVWYADTGQILSLE